MILRELVTKWKFNVDSKPLQTAEVRVNDLKVAAQAAAITLSAQIASIWGFAAATAAVGDQAAKTADKLGIGIEALQEYRFAAGLSGVAQQTFDVALQRFVRRAAEAANGTGEAKAAFEEMGIALRFANGTIKSTQTLFAEVANQFASIEDPARRVRLAFKLFDSEGVGLVNLLKQGAQGIEAFRTEARNLGLVISTDVARASETFNDSQDKLFGVIKGIRNEIGGELLPTLTSLNDKWRDYILANRELIIQNINLFLEKSVNFLDKLGDAAVVVITNIDQMVEAFGGYSRAIDAAAIVTGLLVAKMIAAQAAALAIPLLITAIIALIALLIEDFIVLQEGGESTLQKLADKFEDWYETMEGTPVRDYLESIVDLFKALIEANPFGILDEDADSLLKKLEPLIDTYLRLLRVVLLIRNEIIGLYAAIIRDRVDALTGFIGRFNRPTATQEELDNFTRFLENSRPGSTLSDVGAGLNFTPATNPLPVNRSVLNQNSFAPSVNINISANTEDEGRVAARAAISEIEKRLQEYKDELERDSLGDIER